MCGLQECHGPRQHKYHGPEVLVRLHKLTQQHEGKHLQLDELRGVAAVQ
jgi:hypothetical protein